MKEILLIGEVILARPFQFKQGTRERGRAWQEVASGMVARQFQFDKRTVRDRVAYLCQKVKLNNSRELDASGISVEESDDEKKLRESIEEIIQEEEDVENQPTEAASEARKKSDGAEMRKRACETYGETMKRHEENSITPTRRNRGADVIAIIEKKMEMESARRKEEADKRKEEEEKRKQEAEERINYERAKEERWQQQNMQLQQQLLQQNQQRLKQFCCHYCKL